LGIVSDAPEVSRAARPASGRLLPPKHRGAMTRRAFASEFGSAWKVFVGRIQSVSEPPTGATATVARPVCFKMFG